MIFSNTDIKLSKKFNIERWEELQETLKEEITLNEISNNLNKLLSK